MTTLFNGELDQLIETGRDPHLLLLGRIHDYIEANLGDPELSPPEPSPLPTTYRRGTCTISSRKSGLRWPRPSGNDDSNDAARPQGSGPCRSTGHCHRSPVGVTDAAHFSRIFRAAFGNSPPPVTATPLSS